MKLIFLILILPLIAFSQTVYFNEALCHATDDTVDNYTTQDTVLWRVYAGGVAPGAWNMPTNYITAAEKLAEVTLIYALADESTWTWGEMLEIRIKGETDTTGSKVFRIGHLRSGAVTLFINPDTVLANTNVDYGGSRIGGN